jgi:diguanylate cyclase (GGDEF)-like protein
MAEDFRTPEMYRRELSRMEAAMTAQIGWLKDWHLKVLGATDEQSRAAARLLGPSPFKAWYYGLPSELYDDSPIFAALGFSLESMQTLADQLAGTVGGGGEFSAEDYAAFMDAVGKFTELVFKLMRQSISKIAFIDDITGVGNENGMKIQIAAELERVRRTDQRACVALAEIADISLAGASAEDLSYRVNRQEVLSAFAAKLGDLLRPYDQLFRTADDRFLVSLPYTETNVAELVVNRLHASLTGGNLVLPDETEIEVLLRFGIASIEPDDEVDTVLEHAEQALQTANEPGGQRVMVYRR